MAVWDTSVASGLHPDEPLFEFASEAALANEPILLASPTVQEIAFGLGRRADARLAALFTWFRGLFAVGVLEVLPLSWEAAILAGQLRATLPIPPTGPTVRSPRERGTKPERRAAWIADIQIAATAWLAGEAICTADQKHFEVLGEAIAKLFPGERKLQVLPPPQPASLA
jgi:predicted nucleic acid-binding protein